MAQEPMLRVEHLKKYFPTKKEIGQPQRYVKAVDDVSFSIMPGESLGLVGESGCGKSTLTRSVMRLIEPTEGKIYLDGKDITAMSQREFKPMRKDVQMIFQDPFASLHPRMTVGQIVEEPLIINGYKDKDERKRLVREILEAVGLQEGHLNRYAFEFSGGQRQRIVIARALVLHPRLVILDEPVSALDVSVRSQVLNLLGQLQKDMGLTYLFISHDLSVVEHVCDRVMVMYLGHLMEIGDREQIYTDAAHPYTRALLSAIPSFTGNGGEKIILKGEIPSPINPPSGCVFRTRCPECCEQCSSGEMPLVNVGDGHYAKCCRIQGGEEGV